MLEINIITIFPEVFKDYFNTSIIKRAQERRLVRIKIHNLRDFATDKHKTVASRQVQGNREPRRTVDDRPYGGGPGMILKVEPIYRSIFKNKKLKIKNKKTRIVLLTPTGRQFDQKIARSFSRTNQLILICGHYEGVDGRVEKFIDEKVSIGPYILTGGELPAMVIADAVTRLIPGVIRKESLEEETFSIIQNYTKLREFPNFRKFFVIGKKSEASGEYPQYTRPAVLTIKDKSGRRKVLKVPKVLLSGDHRKIREWREKKMINN